MSQSGKSAGEVTQVAVSPTSSQIAVGYADGAIRLWDTDSGICQTTLTGHKGAVSAIRYDPSGALLASGGRDTNIVVWDISAESGLYKLRSHTGQVTDVVFVSEDRKLISSSKDGLVKVWDLDTQHCMQTLVIPSGEVWSMDIDPTEKRLAVGSNDGDLRVYEVQSNGEKYLVSIGSLRRSAPERAATVRYTKNARGACYLTCQGAGKVVEIWQIRSESEATKKAKRRKKRKREKKKGEEADSVSELDELHAGDELEPTAALRTKHKVRSFAYLPKARSGCVATVVLSLANNSLEMWDVKEAGGSEKVQVIDSAGHRSDVRALALASDDSLCLSASSSGVKVWNARSGSCLKSIDSGYGLSAVFAPGNKHAVVGTKDGALEIFNLNASSKTAISQAHQGAIWSVALLPDNAGIVSGSADKSVKFWDWELADQSLSLVNTRTLKMTDDVLGVRVSPDGRLLAVALLDSTVRIFFSDSLKFFLSLYGHKLPVLCMDISSDSTLLATGSADKNLRIWGLDFGDCHKSMFAHGDSVMAVAFVPGTHYLFTAGKDKTIRYWDADKFEQLLVLEGHQGEVWSLAISSMGDFLISGSHDRSLRRWERTEEPFFLEEEKEKRLESLFEADLEAPEREPLVLGTHTDEAEAAPAGRKTLETVGAADQIIDAIDIATSEEEKLKEYAEDAKHNPSAKAPPPNPLLLGRNPSAYVLSVVSGVRSSDLEQALLLLPFNDALKLLSYVLLWLEHSSNVELLCRIATLLLRLHMQQLMSTPAAKPALVKLQHILRTRVQDLKDVMGYNLAALNYLQAGLKLSTGGFEPPEEELEEMAQQVRIFKAHVAEEATKTLVM